MSTKGRERSREMRAARAAELAREKRRRTIVRVIGGVVILGLVAAIVFAVAKAVSKDDDKPAATGEVVAPANVEKSGGFVVGDADAPVTLELYYDYMCPACGAFEATNGDELSRLIDEGTLKVDLRVMAFLDEQSQGTEYSSRAANAYATVVDADPDHAWDFHAALYANQPTEGTKGLTDGEIADLATGAGVPASVADTFTDGTHRGWVAQMTQDAFAAGVQSTPTVKLDGQVYTGDWSKAGELTKAIEAAAAGAE